MGKPRNKAAGIHPVHRRDEGANETGVQTQEELGQAQNQREQYDRRVNVRMFHLEQKVVLLLPTSENGLLMRWQGPFEVVE